MMQRRSFLGFPVSVLATVSAILGAGCGEQPTEASPLGAPEVTFSEIGDTGIGTGEVNEVTPSTNEANEAEGWAHVIWNSDDAGVGEAPLKLISTRNFYSCFEYRIDGESALDGRDNPNSDISDGLWPYECVFNSSATLDLVAENYVDVRMVFGAEEDERFDWTRFYVLTEFSKDDCKSGQWEALGFKNQGQCVRFIETGSVPDVTGVVTWETGKPDALRTYRSEITVLEQTGGGTVHTLGSDGDWSYDVTCMKIEGNEAWFAGERASDGATVVFYAKDGGDGTDYFNQWTDTPEHPHGYSCDDLGSWSSGKEVTDGDLTIN